MKKTFTILVTTTALTAAIALPALSAMNSTADGRLRPVLAVFDGAARELPIILARSDDDDDDYRRTGRRDRDDDDDDDCEDDDDDDDDNDRWGRSGSDDDDDGDSRRGRYGSDDDDDGDNRRGRYGSDDDDDDDDDCGGAAGNAAPAGTVAPPQNGLFENSAPPRVRVN